MSLVTFFKKHLFRIIVILIMIGTLTYFFLRLWLKGELADTFLAYRDTIVYLLILAFFLMLVSLFIKAYRFYILLRVSSDHLTFKGFLIPFFVGYGFSTIGPLKSGEIVSVEINKRSVSIPRSSSIAAIAFFRILDMLFVLIFFIVALAVTIPKINPANIIIYRIIFYASLGATIILSFILFFPPIGYFTLKILKVITGKFSVKGEKWLEKVIHPALENYYKSLKHLYKQKLMATGVVITTVIRWVLEFYSLKFTLLAFGESISFIDAASISSITLLAGIVTPAGLGTGTITAQVLIEGLSVTITSAIAAAVVIYQTLVGTGLTLSTAAISSIFIKEKELEKTEKDEEQEEDNIENE